MAEGVHLASPEAINALHTVPSQKVNVLKRKSVADPPKNGVFSAIWVVCQFVPESPKESARRARSRNEDVLGQRWCPKWIDAAPRD